MLRRDALLVLSLIPATEESAAVIIGIASDLRPYAAVDFEAPGRAVLIRNDIRKAGWRIIDTDDEFNIVPANSVRALP